MNTGLRRVVESAAAVAAAVWGVLFALYLLGTRLPIYDDEGYFLVVLGKYFREGPAAAGTYSNYGPFPYFVQHAIFGLMGWGVTHDAGRMATLACWVAAAVFGGMIAWRLSGSLMLGAAGMLACMRVLRVLAQEPGHPQQVEAVLLALGCWLAVSGSLVGVGLAGAALAFTKINVGGFYLVALAHAAVCLLPRGRWRTAGLAGLMVYAVLAAPLLARGHLSTVSAGFALVASLCTAATFAWGSAARAEVAWGTREIGALLGGVAAGAVAIVAVTLAQGVSLGALIEGIVLMPARNPAGGLFMGFELGWVECAVTVAVLGLVSWRRWPGSVRAGAGVVVIFLLVRLDLTWVMPLLPLGVMPPAGREWSAGEWFARLFVADLAATQFLQTYPVAGGQAGLAALPVMIWAFLCVSDGLEEMGRPRWRVWVGAILAMAVAAAMWLSGLWHMGFPYPASRLRGSASLHLRPDQEETYQYLSDEIRKNCSMLFALPRLGSLNIWSGVRPVPGTEMPLSFQMYPAALQARVLEQLRGDSRACAVYNRKLLEFWQPPAGVVEGSALAQYVIREMPVAASRAGFEVKINPKRIEAWRP